MKLKYILPAAAVISAVMCASVYAANVSVNVDGEEVVFSDVKPVIVNDRTYVPLRGVFEKLGYEIAWDADIKTATLTKEGIEITANTGDLRVNKGGANRAVGGGNFPIIRDDRFLLPIRAISEASGCTVNWDQDTKTVEIFTEDTEKSDYTAPNGNATANEEDYIKAAYSLCNEIRDIASRSDNAALLRFMERGYVNDDVVLPSTASNARLKEIADELYALEPASGMASLQPYFKNYSDNICKFIDITEKFASGALSAQDATAQIDELREEKEELAINFSVVLYEYFTAKNVFYEGVYDEYVLDMLK